MNDRTRDIVNRATRETSPRYIASRLDAHIRIPRGTQERFAGYGIMGLPFASGHVLALRRFRSSSLGSGYTSLWHRTPEGEWTFYSDVDPSLACTRYFGSAVESTVIADIQLAWVGSHRLDVSIPSAGLDWSIELASTSATQAINWISRRIPRRLWHSKLVLSLTSGAAGRLLDVGHIALHGCVPNGQRFMVNPRLIWSVADSTAVWRGADLGRPRPLDGQARLGDFWIPNRGIFAVGEGYFEPFDASRHRAETSRQVSPETGRSSSHRSVVAGEALSLD